MKPADKPRRHRRLDPTVTAPAQIAYEADQLVVAIALKGVVGVEIVWQALRERRPSEEVAASLWPVRGRARDGLARLLSVASTSVARAQDMGLPDRQTRLLAGDLSLGAVWVDLPAPEGARSRSPKLRDLRVAATVLSRLLDGRCVVSDCGARLRCASADGRRRGARVYCSAHEHLLGLGDPPELEAARRLLERVGAALERLEADS